MTELQVMKRLSELAKEQKELLIALDDHRANKKIACASCGNLSKIRNIDLIDVESYTEPYSCTGGDYWSHDEYNYICCFCNVRNRFLSNLYYKIKYSSRQYHNVDTYFFSKYRPLFKSCKVEAEPRHSIFTTRQKFVNNYYVEDNLAKFIGKAEVENLKSHFGQ